MIINIFLLRGNPQVILPARNKCSVLTSRQEYVPWRRRFEVYILPHLSTATIALPHLLSVTKTTFQCSEGGGVERLPSSRGSLYWEMSRWSSEGAFLFLTDWLGFFPAFFDGFTIDEMLG